MDLRGWSPCCIQDRSTLDMIEIVLPVGPSCIHLVRLRKTLSGMLLPEGFMHVPYQILRAEGWTVELRMRSS